jgi:hypothetical protein
MSEDKNNSYVFKAGYCLSINYNTNLGGTYRVSFGDKSAVFTFEKGENIIEAALAKLQEMEADSERG